MVLVQAIDMLKQATGAAASSSSELFKVFQEQLKQSVLSFYRLIVVLAKCCCCPKLNS